MTRKMKDVKDSYPVQLAEYAVENGISDKPAFAWWVPFTMKKREQIISKIKSKYWQRTHKYGIQIPKNMEQAKAIDKRNNNTLWQDAIALEMKNVMIAFEEVKDPSSLPWEYNEVSGHLVFDVKLQF